MNYRIIEKPSFHVAMVSRRFSTVDGQNFRDIPAWWGELMQSPDCTALREAANNVAGAVTGGEMLGVCFGEAETGEFSYGIGVEMPDGGQAGKFEDMEIPASTWAVFDCTLGTLQDTAKRIWAEWYPSAGYENPGTPDLEVYLEEGVGDDMKVELWMPVKKK